MFRDFRQFILRGNVIDLAVGVVIGAAFGAVVSAFVRDLITPVIAAIGGKPDFAALSFAVNGSVFRYGHLINAIISFLIVASAVFFVVVFPLRRLEQVISPEEGTLDPTTRSCPECLNEIPRAASRCGFCTSEVGPEKA